MKKKFLMFLSGLVFIVTVAAGVYLLLQLQKADSSIVYDKPTKTEKKSANKPAGFDKAKYSTETPGSLWWVVSKTRPLPEDYAPSDLVTPNVTLNSSKSAEENTLRKDTATAIEQLFASAKHAGFEYMLASGYRSPQLQATYYNNYVKTSGQTEANRYSAKPGTSEHQTGLALDIAPVDRTHYLDQAFGSDPAGVWLAAHAHEYGFIIRYLQGKEAITGYMYEPWHVRYVGKELSTELYKNNLTMEEFFGLTS